MIATSTYRNGTKKKTKQLYITFNNDDNNDNDRQTGDTKYCKTKKSIEKKLKK